MDFSKQYIKQNVSKANAFSQVTVDDDYVVKDNKPDVVRIIRADGRVKIEETKVGNQAIWISGKLEFEVLYKSDDTGNKMDAFCGAVILQEKMYVEGLEEFDNVSVTGTIDDLTIGIINSRKLAIRAVLNFVVEGEETREEMIVSGIESYDKNFMAPVTKVEEKEILCLKKEQKDTLRVKEMIMIPNTKSNIREIVSYDVDVRGLEYYGEEHRVEMRGEAFLCVIYRNEEGQLEWYDASIPFSGYFDAEGCKASDLYYVKVLSKEYGLEIIGDNDGEMRALELELLFSVDMRCWEEVSVPVLMDAYALDRNLVLEREPMNFKKLLVKNTAKLRLNENFQVDDAEEKILQICSYHGKVCVEHTEVVENGLEVLGIVTVYVMYATPEDGFPMACVSGQLAFEQVVDVPGLKKEDCFYLECGLDQLQVNLLDSSEYEAKVSIKIDVMAFGTEKIERVINMEEIPLDGNGLQDYPGIVAYIPWEEEALWDIAKKFKTTVEEIKENNGLKSENVKKGEKLLIVKQVD